MNKKKWIKPELIVLTRSRSEENVLCLCKTVSYLEGNSAGEYCIPPMCYSVYHGRIIPSRNIGNS